MNRLKYTFFILVVFMILRCQSAHHTGEIEKIQVEWELSGNYGTGDAGGLAGFIFRNEGKFTLDASNWVLYFNMAPRKILPADDTAIADVMHINGDWYRLVPRNNFLLKPGQAIRIWYRFEGCMLKECDAPLGLYFVLYNKTGEENGIVPVHDYTIAPFHRENQVKCHPEDRDPESDPAHLYENYEALNTPRSDSLLPIIPTPVILKIIGGTVRLDTSWKLQFNPGLENEANLLSRKLSSMAGIDLSSSDEKNSLTPVIQLILNPVTVSGKSEESYKLNIRENLITIEGSQAGVFYGIQSLLQLIPWDVIAKRPGYADISKLTAEDTPRFAYRGQHIDVCRNFQTKKEILRIIDLMAWYKLNRLHLYLTEDEAWRLQIKNLPELTEIGAQRGHTLDDRACLPPAYGSGPFTLAENNHGSGYYSRDDFREILQYAYQRHILVIPCINFPGHARAAIKAMEARYERLMAENREAEANEFRLIDPDDESVYLSAQFYNDNVVCVARESVYHFFETVLDDILAQYEEAGVPVDRIFTGGDEVPEGVWTRSPLCDSLLASLPGIRDPKNLQNYFFNRVLNILAERGLMACGWEEVALIKDPSGQYRVNPAFADRNVVPYIWNNLGASKDLGYRIANAGYSVVLCPVSNFYFDLAYNDDPREPGLYWGGFNDERDAWEFAPEAMLTDLRSGRDDAQDVLGKTRVRLNPEARKHILGLQAQLWHETIRGPEMMEYSLFPKMIAFAERCWAATPDWEKNLSQPGNQKVIAREWQIFSNTLYREDLPKLSYLNNGYNYRIPPAGAVVKEGLIYANAVSPGLTIRYTIDGSIPDINSPVYTHPIEAERPVMFRVFDTTGHASRITEVY